MEKIEISNKTFQILLLDKMDSENIFQEAIYCEDDGEYRVYCITCESFCIEIFYKNHLKSRTHTIKICKREQLDK